MFALRAGSCPHASVSDDDAEASRRPCIKLFKEPTTVRTSESTYNNRLHLAEEFVGQIVSMYEGTRLGRQEIYAEMLDLVDGVRTASFDRNKHVTQKPPEYRPAMGRSSSRYRLRNIANDRWRLVSNRADRSVYRKRCQRVRRLP